MTQILQKVVEIVAVGRQLLSDHAKLEKTCSPALLGLAKEQFT